MGSKQSTETKHQILNDTDFRNAVKKSNELVNNITSELVQKNLMTSSSAATTTQELEISNLHAKGDVTISDVSQEATITINVSALSDTDLKEELVQEVTNELRDKIKNLSEASQKQLEDQGEQIFSEIVGALSKTMSSLGQSVTGGSSKDKTQTSLQNLIGVDNETDLNNLVEESVSTNIVNETVNDISNDIVGQQSMTINDIRSEEGKIVISKVSQKILTTQIQESVQKSGMSDAIIAKFSGFSQTEIENINKSTQDLTSKKQSTLDATFGGLSKLVSSSMIPFIVIGVVVVIVAFVGIFLFFGMTSGGSGGGGGGTITIAGNSGDSSGSNISTQQGIIDKLKGNTSGNSTVMIIAVIIIIIVIIVIIVVIYYATKSKKETFSKLKNLSKLAININGKWMNKDNTPKLLNSKGSAQPISVTLLNKTELYISKKSGKKSLYLKHNKSKNIYQFTSFNVGQKPSYKFTYIPAHKDKDDNMYYLMQKMNGKDHYITLNLQTNFLNNTPKKSDAAVIKFVQIL